MKSVVKTYLNETHLISYQVLLLADVYYYFLDIDHIVKTAGFNQSKINHLNLQTCNSSVNYTLLYKLCTWLFITNNIKWIDLRE